MDWSQNLEELKEIYRKYEHRISPIAYHVIPMVAKGVENKTTSGSGSIARTELT